MRAHINFRENQSVHATAVVRRAGMKKKIEFILLDDQRKYVCFSSTREKKLLLYRTTVRNSDGRNKTRFHTCGCGASIYCLIYARFTGASHWSPRRRQVAPSDRARARHRRRESLSARARSSYYAVPVT